MGCPQCKDSSLSDNERGRQEKILLEKGARDICAYWSELTFGGHPVVPVECNGRPGDFMKSANAVNDFIIPALRGIRSGKHQDPLQLFKFAASHVDRRKNEVTFRKCQFQGKTPCEVTIVIKILLRLRKF